MSSDRRGITQSSVHISRDTGRSRVDVPPPGSGGFGNRAPFLPGWHHTIHRPRIAAAPWTVVGSERRGAFLMIAQGAQKHHSHLHDRDIA